MLREDDAICEMQFCSGEKIEWMGQEDEDDDEADQCRADFIFIEAIF